jgi:hypothetical protein
MQAFSRIFRERFGFWLRPRESEPMSVKGTPSVLEKHNPGINNGFVLTKTYEKQGPDGLGFQVADPSWRCHRHRSFRTRYRVSVANESHAGEIHHFLLRIARRRDSSAAECRRENDPS